VIESLLASVIAVEDVYKAVTILVKLFEMELTVNLLS
jgi:hypothetical protein